MSDSGEGRLLVTPSNHAAYVVIAAVTGISWTLLASATRIGIKVHVRDPFNVEELLYFLGSLFAIASTTVVFAAVHYGLGQKAARLSELQIDKMLQCLYASLVLYLVALAASKCTMVCLISRLTRVRRHIWECYFLLGLTIAWGIASVFAIAFECNMPDTWDIRRSDHCADRWRRWVVIEVFSMTIEVLIVGVSIDLVWGLHMPVNSKIKVIIAFLTRLPIIIPTVFRIKLLKTYLRSSDISFAATNVTIATIAVVHYTVMAASFAYLKPFLRAFNSNLGATTMMDSEGVYATRKSNNYALDTVRSTASVSHAPRQTESAQRPQANEPVPQNRPMVRQPANRGQGPTASPPASVSSQAPIIMKTQTWEVRSELT